jgi:hypothetical protein
MEAGTGGLRAATRREEFMYMQSRMTATLAVLGLLALAPSLPAQSFDDLFRVTGCRGNCLVKKPGSAAFEPVFNGKAYPFGTTVRTGDDSELFVVLSTEDTVRLLPNSELSVWEPAGSAGNSNRVVRFQAGKIELATREGLAQQSLVVETELASCDSFTGRSAMEVQKKTAKKPVATQLDLSQKIATENGALRVRGPQFTIPKLKSGSSVRLDASRDRAITRITNESNDYLVNIENGTDTPVSLETTTHSTVRICREHAPVGGKLVVSVLETAPDGKGKGNFAFVLGQQPSPDASALPILDDRALTGGVVSASAPTNNATSVQQEANNLF